jgi:glycosyltransferase involved in cell wall biosynthesis
LDGIDQQPMAQCDPNPPTAPRFSIIIPAYNDWGPLDRCLESLAQQSNTPSFEVIVVDDGSGQTAPESIRRWGSHYPLTIFQQSHAGVSVARNLGIQMSKGAILLCVDADCKLQPDCLANLDTAICDSVRHDCFQLHLVGNSSGMVGRAEHLRLETLQNHMLQADGCIRYLNTAGFAIRRTRVDVAAGLFDPIALRAEDTLLLANLIQDDELPFFVDGAVVQHAIPLSLAGYIRKAIRSAYLEARTYNIIAAKRVRIRVSNRERLNMLRSMWKTSRQPAIGRPAWVVLVIKQAIQRTSSLVYRFSLFPSSPPPQQVLPEHPPMPLKAEDHRIVPR